MKWKTNTAKLNRHCAYRLREPKDSIRTIYTLCIVFTIVSVIWAVNADCQVDPTTGAEIQRLEGLLQRDPGNREVHHNLAKNLSWSKRYEESIAEYRRLLAAKEEPAIRSELIDVLMWAGKHDEALAEVDSILAKDPANIKAALQRARALLLSAQEIDAPTAQDWGIVSEIVSAETLSGRARAIAGCFVNASGVALALTKAALGRTFESDLAAMLEVEASLQGIAFSTPYHRDAGRRFLDKQPLLFQWPAAKPPRT